MKEHMPNLNSSRPTDLTCPANTGCSVSTTPLTPLWDDWVRAKTAPCAQLVCAGLVKNAGKTTALNAINNLLSAEILGLTSIGYDGEDRDAIYNHPKPAIAVSPGQLVLTAERFLPAEASTQCLILEEWGNHPQFGSWLILRITEEGRFRMAGPSSLPELQTGIAALRRHGATRIHIDGALNRLSHLTLADSGIILSTGAALGNLDQTVQRSAHILELFQLPTFTPTSLSPDLPIPSSASPLAQSAYLLNGQWYSLPPFLWTLDLSELLPPKLETLYLNGALTDRLYALLLRARRLPKNLIVNTPAQIMVSSDTYQGLRARGVKLQLLQAPALLMLTLNSWHPINPIPTDQLAEKLIKYSHVPLVDIQQRKIWNPMEVKL